MFKIKVPTTQSVNHYNIPVYQNYYPIILTWAGKFLYSIKYISTFSVSSDHKFDMAKCSGSDPDS